MSVPSRLTATRLKDQILLAYSKSLKSHVLFVNSASVTQPPNSSIPFVRALATQQGRYATQFYVTVES